LEYLFERSAKAWPAITVPYAQLAPALKTPPVCDGPKFRKRESFLGFGMYSPVALEFEIGCPFFELFGQKRRIADKTNATVPQFSEESDPRVVGE
jgi:hypothetical protein